MAPKLLIVDDDPGIRALLTSYFTRRGWSASTAASGAQALTAFVPGTYDLVLCDVDLRDADGLAVAEVLRARQDGLKVIVMSGRPENLERARQAGFRRCLAKPFDWAKLAAWSPRPRRDLSLGDRTRRRGAAYP